MTPNVYNTLEALKTIIYETAMILYHKLIKYILHTIQKKIQQKCDKAMSYMQNHAQKLIFQLRTYYNQILELPSVQFSHSVMSNSLQPHGLQYARPPCPSPTPGVYPNSCLSHWWCHPTISSCHPLLLLPSIFPSIRVFSHESVLCIRWPQNWSFSFSSSHSNEYSGLISFRMNWLYLLAVQGSRKSCLQHHSSKASILCTQLSL